MQYQCRKQLPHSIPHWVDTDNAVFFITVCCEQKGENVLCNQKNANAIWESIETRIKQDLWHPHLVLLMPDHLHMLVVFNLHLKSMSKIMASWKSWCRKKTGINWQRSFFDHRLRNDESLREKAGYILNNPVRKQYVKEWKDWKYYWLPSK
ncbi:transposase [Verrucomicrobiota bacterium]